MRKRRSFVPSNPVPACLKRPQPHVKASGSTTLAGAQAFTLHDTYGFPIDLTLEMAAEAGLDVDQEGFNALMAEQRARAKADNKAKKHGHVDLSIYREFVDEHPTTFTGFDELESDAKVLGLVVDGELRTEAHEGESVEVIVDITPMYAESGGQLGDRGVITAGNSVLRVGDVQKIGKKLWVHKAVVEHGGVSVGIRYTRASISNGDMRHGKRTQQRT